MLFSENLELTADLSPNLGAIFDAWDILHSQTVAATPSGTLANNVWSFAESCICFYAIQLRSNACSQSPGGDLQPLTVDVIGIIYITSTLHESEATVGVALTCPWRGNGYGTEAIKLLLGHAFDQMHFHRVQAVVPEASNNDQALRMFTKLGFAHEGTRRKATFCPVDKVWKNVTYLAMIDTDWVIRESLPAAPNSLWDELFARHQREREELLALEEKRTSKPIFSNTAPMTRTKSVETLKIEWEFSEDEDLAESSTVSVSKDLEPFWTRRKPGLPSLSSSPYTVPANQTSSFSQATPPRSETPSSDANSEKWEKISYSSGASDLHLDSATDDSDFD